MKRMESWGIPLFMFFALALVTAPTAFAQEMNLPAPHCTINFDTSCPNVARECGTKFNGGVGCVIEGLANCYDTGFFSYKLDPGDRTAIRLRKDRDVTALSVFFVHAGVGEGGQMRFFDANGLQVGSIASTNGDCLAGMPDRQTLQFNTSIRRIVVTAIDTPVYIDTFEINPPLE